MSPKKRFVLSVDPQEPPEGLAGAVVAIGNFDGVHRGHKAVIARALALARHLSRPCALLSFEPHPADFFAGKSVIFRLTSLEAKAHILARLGLDGLIALDFNSALAQLDAESFVREVLLRRLAVSAVVVGYDFHFGAKRTGSPEFLRESGRKHGFITEIVDKISADAQGDLDAVSSTRTRQALEAGDVETAEALLGHPYSVVGTIIHGAKLGRTIGYPTANIALDPSCRLKHAIYAVEVELRGEAEAATPAQRLKGVASFGRRPTVDNGPPLLEVYIFDFSGDLYGQEIEVFFLHYLRDEAKFDGLDALLAQIRRDEAAARAKLVHRPNQMDQADSPI